MNNIPEKLSKGSWKDACKTLDKMHRESLKNSNKRKLYAHGS